MSALPKYYRKYLPHKWSFAFSLYSKYFAVTLHAWYQRFPFIVMCLKFKLEAKTVVGLGALTVVAFLIYKDLVIILGQNVQHTSKQSLTNR